MRRAKNTALHNCNMNGYRIDLSKDPIKMLLGSTKHPGRNIGLVWPIEYSGAQYYTTDGITLYHENGMEVDLNDIKRNGR